MKSLHLRWLAGDGRPRAFQVPLWLLVLPLVVPLLLALALAVLWSGDWSPSRLRDRLDAVTREDERLDRELSTARGGMELARKALRMSDKERQSVEDLSGMTRAPEEGEVARPIPDVGAMIASARRIRSGYDAMQTWFESHPSETGRLPTIRPVPSSWPLVEDFGTELDPFTGQEIEFPGMAWSVPVGTPVWATGAGTVVAVGTQGRWGKYIEIRHDPRCVTFYAHLSRIDAKEGETLVRGQVVGLSGESGKVTAPQLVYAVFLDGEAVDPAAFLLPENSR
jgi:murein DD-endopeptidase MepM/ murein hydrolase activator NlpD